jgi:hypothetical protein
MRSVSVRADGQRSDGGCHGSAWCRQLLYFAAVPLGSASPGQHRPPPNAWRSSTEGGWLPEDVNGPGHGTASGLTDYQRVGMQQLITSDLY